MAILTVQDSFERSGDCISYDRISRVIAIHGRTIARWVTLLQGTHTLTMSCEDDEYKLVFSQLGDHLRIAGTAAFNGYDCDLRLPRPLRGRAGHLTRTWSLRQVGAAAQSPREPFGNGR